LQGAQPDQIPFERERRAVPEKTIHAIAEQWHFVGVSRVNAGAAFSPVEIDARVGREIRMGSDAEQTALGRAVDGEIEHSALHDAVRHAQDFAGRFLQHEEIVRADEGERNRLIQIAHKPAHAQARFEHRRAGDERGRSITLQAAVHAGHVQSEITERRSRVVRDG